VGPESEARSKQRGSFSLRARSESFGHAFRGILSLIRSEHNARIHALATLLVIAFGIGLEIGRGEWLAVVLALALVWSAEAMNTAIEAVCDLISPDHDPRVKTAKDAAAGAVLLSSIGALIVGVLVFAPRLLLLWTRL
jgi:diacylglycerol kinase (ATP)